MTKQPNSPQNGPQQGNTGQQRGESGARQQQQFESADSERFAAQIRDNMAVIGSDGRRIGEVDRVEGDRIKLTRADWPNDGAPGASHHFLPLGQVQSIEGDSVRLRIDSETAQREAVRL